MCKLTSDMHMHELWLSLSLTTQHDAQLDYYGRRLATCSSDRTVKIFEVVNNTQNLVATLVG